MVELLRPVEATLEGYAWLPRMLDKARAEHDGVETGYPFGCPVDHTCMARLHITPELVRQLVARHGDDDDAILAELRSIGIPSAEEEYFDARALEDDLGAGGPYLRVRAQEVLDRDRLAGGAVFAGGEHGASVSLVVVEASPGERQPPHRHLTEEVTVVTSGRATFHLGEVQARTVTAGQIVRVPANISHWWENTGTDTLQAVSAYAAPAVESTPPD